MPNNINTSAGLKKLIVSIILIIATLAVFWQVNQFDFVNIDDPVYVIENHHIQSGITLKSLSWAFNIENRGFWHPLTWVSLILDYHFHGLNAGGYHLTNLVIHILSTLLLFWFFCRVTGAVWKSAFIAAFFALHPLHVESVAWISERKGVLSAFFWILTLCLYLYYTEKPLIKRYLLVLFSFICALMSKSIVITLPVIMIILDYWPLSRYRIGIESKKNSLLSWQLREKAPFFILSLLFSVMTILAQYKMSAEYASFPFDSRIVNSLISFILYLGKLFYPSNMTFFYPFIDQYPFWQIIASAFIVLFISIVVIVKTRELPYLLIGWFWYVITISPVLGIIQFSSQAMADRYVYLPSIGISVMLAWGVPPLFQNGNLRKKILFTAAITFLVILGLITWKQCDFWKNSVKLLNHALYVRGDVYIVHDCLGLALFAEGQNKEAIDHFNQALLLRPDYANAFYNRGIVYSASAQYKKSIQDFDKTIHLKPDYIPAYYNRAVAFSKTGQYQEAINDYSRIISLKPDDAVAYYNRGAVYFNMGNHELGCRDAQKACERGVCKVLKISRSHGSCQ